jgi:hypothetical protein
MALPYVLLFTVAGIFSPTSKPHWTLFGYTTAIIAIPCMIAQALRRWPRQRGLVLTLTGLALGLALFLTVLLFVQSAYPVVKLKPKEDTTNELYGWPQAGAAIAAAREQMQSSGPVIIAAPRYNIASQVTFYTPGHPPVFSVSSVREQHDLWGRGSIDSLLGINVLFVMDNRYRFDIAARYVFDRIDTVATLPVFRKGQRDPVRWFYLYRCFNLQGPVQPVAGR